MKYSFCLFFLLINTMQASQNVVIVLDDSGSMKSNMQNGQSRMSNAKTALQKVISDLPEDTNLGLVALNSNPEWVIPFGHLNKSLSIESIGKIKPNNGTPLGAKMKIGTDKLLEWRSKEHYGSYRLLIVTDGEAGDENLVESYLPDILSRGIIVDVIGVDMVETHSLATKVHNYRRGDNLEELTKAISATFAETNYNDANMDFDLIAALPDEMAPQVIDALKETGNYPIGEKPVVASLSENAGGQGGGWILLFVNLTAILAFILIVNFLSKL